MGLGRRPRRLLGHAPPPPCITPCSPYGRVRRGCRPRTAEDACPQCASTSAPPLKRGGGEGEGDKVYGLKARWLRQYLRSAFEEGGGGGGDTGFRVHGLRQYLRSPHELGQIVFGFLGMSTHHPPHRDLVLVRSLQKRFTDTKFLWFMQESVMNKALPPPPQSSPLQGPRCLAGCPRAEHAA